MRSQFIERSFPSVDSSNTLKEAVVSVTTLGAAIGAFCGGFFSDYYGRCGRELRLHAPRARAPRADGPRPGRTPPRRSAILTSDLIFAMAALKMGVAMTPRQLIEGRWVMARARAAAARSAHSL